MERMSKQLVLSGKLKPEARLGLEISNFAQSLDDERRQEFRSMQTAKSPQISGWDVIKVTEEVNQEGARRHRSWRPHATKVGVFLSRIQTFASIGDVLIGGSQNLIACGVWTAVRLSLTFATNYLSYFEKLSTLFMRLGTSWALHEDFAQLFPRSQILQTYFCEYLIVLMKLCNKIVLFGWKNAGYQLFSSLGSSFDSEFGAIQKELDQWGCLIQQQSQLLAMKTVTGAENRRSHDLKQQILRRLSPYQNDFETRWRRQRKKGNSEWIFDAPGFEDWKSMRTSATLCISGKLGSGKTVSMANILARTDLEHPCAHAFCASQEPTSLKATSILGSIAFNLLDHLPPESIAWEDDKQLDSMINTLDPDGIINFLLRLLPVDLTYIIIVDGLEDCPDADMKDVISGLLRLKGNRIALLCYSSRSDSRFHHIAKQYLAPEFSISHDSSNHDVELESYIVEEVTRRNATRHLSLDLEELVKKQLIVGAQGMYLWASLQIDTILPINSNLVVTDDRILELITHLPKDLPEAFERALEGITDHQYEGRIMKLVMAAATPLDLDELRVALCVVPGDPVWHPERMVKDGKQLISFCGGNLLELDEEDGKVRFIHYSVIQHLLSSAEGESTTPYHFTAEAAENFIGATCVTYLNLPVLDSRLAIRRNIQGQEMLDNLIESTGTKQSLAGVSRLVSHIRSRDKRRARSSQFDIGHLLSQIQATRIQQALDPCCFLRYATNNWIFHTRFFDDKTQDCKESWKLWWRLLNGAVATVEPPFADLSETPFKALLWAVEHAHGSTFRNILALCGLLRRQVAEVMRALELHKSIHGQWLGDILAQYLQSSHTVDLPLTADRVKFLLDMGANPRTPHSIMKSSPVEILTHKICTDALSVGDERQLMYEVFVHPALQSLEDGIMLQTLEKLTQSHKSEAAAGILDCRPDLNLVFHQNQVVSRYGRAAIEEAINDDRWEEYDILTIPDAVKAWTFSGTTLLWKAIEEKSYGWVYNILRAGADPNVGPFKMKHNIASRIFVGTCYPLEAALWLRRTRVCLELLHHNADIWGLGYSPMQISQDTGNWIMIAKLCEIKRLLEWQEQGAHRRRYKHGHTALMTACKMLSHTGLDEPLGFPTPPHNSILTCDWLSELHEIIHQLARDADSGYVNAQDTDGKTALHYLSEAKCTTGHRLNKLVRLLLGLGADPNLPDCHDETPLWLAIRNSLPIDSIVKPLLEAGADPNAARLSHNSAILKEAMIAYEGAEQDVIRLVRLLLQSGADTRDPVTFASADPYLIASARGRGMESLIEDFKEYTNRSNGENTEAERNFEREVQKNLNMAGMRSLHRVTAMREHRIRLEQ